MSYIMANNIGNFVSNNIGRELGVKQCRSGETFVSNNRGRELAV